MKPTTALAVCLAAWTPLAAAWPAWLPDIDSLVVRQNNENEESATPSATPASSAEESAASNSASDEDSETTTTRNTRRPTDLNTASLPSGSESGSASETGTRRTTSTGTRTRSIGPTVPAGGIVMLTPAPTDFNSKLYMVGNWVTFGWNYTNVIAEPSAIDVLVSCSRATATWTLTQNMTFSTQVNILWDTSKEDSNANPLLTDEFTLIVKDVEADITATPRPGHLAVADQFKFDMYLRRPYTNLSEWNNPTRSGALPAVDRQAVGLAMAMSAVTVASFTWFVTGIL